ncbi:MAG TPA: SulP family inorganic anion transporter [Saprospiraceae bacterium]|nr:SulP family inorganic anion transporter [Saprospiraceae bacterium]HMQ81713.1 SulP family inorganic anion transporter [Saprospiraceae bacterium]
MKKLFAEWRSDLPAGLIVFLVAVPLCLGIALASGAPLFSGIIAGIIGGTVVALASGSALGVSGPAAGLAVIVLTAIQDLGSFETFLLAVFFAGVVQLLLGFAKAGIIGYYFPSSVIKGMLAGIGLIIFLKQIPHALGYDSDYEGDLAFLQADGDNTFSALSHAMSLFTPAAVIISLSALAILIIWERPFMKRIKLFQIVQGPLVVVVLGILMNVIFRGTPLAIAPEHLVSLPVASDFSSFLSQFSFPDFSQVFNTQVYVTAITLAIVASLETLLCVEATDKLDPYKRFTPTNTELKAQGLGNMISGLIGGLPITQVIVRSSANIQSGGKTKAAAFFHGILLLVCVAFIPNILNMIPLASLAAILIMVGYKLAKPSLFKEMYRLGWKQFAPFLATVVAILLTDLLVGIGIGLVVAIFYILLNNYRAPYFFQRDKHHEGETIVITLSEDVSFLNKASIMLTLKKLPANSKVILDASHCIHIDYDVIDIFNDFKTNAKYKGIDLEIIGLDPETFELKSDKAKYVPEKPSKLVELTD